MPDPIKQLYDYFRPDNEWMGELDQFNTSLSDTSRRRQFYDHFSPDNSWMGKYEDFNKRVLPAFPPIEPDPVDTTETVPKIVPPKELKQKYKFDRNNPVPSIMMAVTKMEGLGIPGGRADIHNQYGAHIVPSDSTKRQHLIDNYGMEVGDSLPDNPNLFTARYPTKALGKAASDYILNDIYEAHGGDVERFLAQYTGLPQDSEEYKNYLSEVRASVDRNKEGGYVDTMSKNLYTKFPNLPKVDMRGIKNYVNPYGAGTPIEFVEDSYGKRVEFDVDKMTETDVMLDALHGIQGGDDILLSDKYNKFAEEIVNTRGEDIDYFYEQALQENPDLPQEEFVRNFVDSQLRAIVAQEVGGASDPQYKLDYKDINQLAPNAVGMGQDILSYLRGYSDQIVGSDPSLFMPVTADPVSIAYAAMQQEEAFKERLTNKELIALAQKPIDDQKLKVDKYFVADKRIGEKVNEEVGLWNTAFASSLESILQGKNAEKSFKPIVDYFNRFQDEDKEITMEELAANFGRGVTSFMLLPAEMTKEAVKNPIKFAGDLIHFFGVDAPLMVSDLFTAAQLNPIVQTRIAMGDEEAVKDLKQAQHNVATYPVETLISVLGMKTAVKGIGKAPTAIPNAFNMALDKIQMSDWYRMRTIKERGLIIQSVDQYVAANPNASMAEILRHAKRISPEEFLRQREKIDPVIKFEEKPVETVSRKEVPVEEPIVDITYEPPVEEGVKTLEQFKETPEVTYAAPSEILQLAPEEMLKINEKDYTKNDIEFLAEVLNVAKTGSKSKVLGNIKNAVEVRMKIAEETVESLSAMPGKDLGEMADKIRLSKTGTKGAIAKKLLDWADKSRKKGQGVIAETNYLNYLRSLEEAGVELTSDMIGGLDYLKTKQAGLDVKLVHKVPTAALVKTEGQIADIKKAEEVGIKGKGEGLASLTDEAVRLMEEGDNEGALAIVSKIEKIAEEGDPNYIMATPANQVKQKLQAKANAEELRKRLGETEEVVIEVEPTPEEFVEQAELELEEVPEVPVEEIKIPEGEETPVVDKIIDEGDIKKVQDCPAGECFRNALNAARENDALGAKVVQGKVFMMRVEGMRDHAWVEIGDKVYDPTIDLISDKKEFYDSIADPEVVNVLTVEEASILMMHHGYKMYTPEDILSVEAGGLESLQERIKPTEAPEITETPPSQRDYDLDNELDLIPEKESFQVTETKKIALELVNVDPARFQPGKRGGETGFNQEFVDILAENFDEAEFEPVWIWKDPADGKYYVLIGHHRTAAIKQTGRYQDMPVKIFEGTEEEAILKAHTDNPKRLVQTEKDTIPVVASMHKQGISPKEILKELPGLKNESTIQRLIDLSYLDTGGNFMMHYDNNTMTSIKGNAQMVAKYRKRLGEAFTDSHEQEIFEYLYMKGGIKATKGGQPIYREIIDNAIERNMLIGNFTGDPLRITSPIARSSAEIEYDEQLEELNRAIKKVEKKRRDLVKRAAATGAGTKEYKDAVSKIDEELLFLTSKMQSMAIGRNDFLDSIRRQANLFGSPNASLHGREQGIDDIQMEELHTHIRTFKVTDSVRKIYKAFDVPLAEKRLSNTLLGYFHKKAKNVRIQSSFDVLTAIHELTHALDDRHGIVNKIMQTTGITKDGKPIYDKQFAPVRKILTQQYLDWYPGAKKSHPLEIRLKEGLAVLMEHYLTNPALMRRSYGDMVDELLLESGALYHKDLLNIIDLFRAIASEYSTLSPMERMIDPLVNLTNRREKAAGSMSIAQKIEFHVFNLYEPVQRWAKTIGIPDTSVENPYVWSTTLATTGQYIQNAINGTGSRGFTLIDPRTGAITVRDYSVQTYMEKIKTPTEEKQFGGILIARRYIGDFRHMEDAEVTFIAARERLKPLAIEYKEMIEEGLYSPEVETEYKKALEDYNIAKRDYDHIRNVVIEDHGKSKTQLIKSIREAQVVLKDLADGRLTIVNEDGTIKGRIDWDAAERYRDALVIYDKINNDVVTQAYRFGLISEQKKDKYIEQNNEGYYAPFYRSIFDENKDNHQGLAQQSLNIIRQGNQFKTRRGATHDIINPIIGQVRNIVQVFDSGVRNTFFTKTADMALLNTDLARRFTKDPKVPRRWIPWQETSRGMEGGYWDYSIADGRVRRGGDYQRIYRDGKKEYYFVAEEFATMADVINYQHISGLLRIPSIPARLFQRLTTQYFPLFAFKNLPMDIVALLLNTKTGAKPIIDHATLVGSWLAHRIINMDSKQLKALEEFKAKGGERQATAYFMDMDMTTVNDVIKVAKQRKTKIGRAGMKIVHLPGDIMSLPSNWTEIASRSIEFWHAKEMGMSDIEALHLANQSTTPFTQRGAYLGSPGLRVLVQSIAFMRSTLNAFWKFYKNSFRDQPKRALPVIGAIIGSVTAAYYAMLGHMDDDEREQFIDFIANRHIEELVQYIWIPIANKKGYATLRVPEEVGTMMAISYMMIINRYRENEYKNDEFVEALLQALPDQFAPYQSEETVMEGFKQGLSQTFHKWMPQGYKAIQEPIYNKRSFPQLMPIVPKYLEDKDKTLQYNEYTSRFARTIGEIADVSPMKVDHFIRLAFSQVGGLITHSTELAQWLGRKNPLYKQMDYFVTNGRLYEKFYDDFALVKRQGSLISAGEVTDSKNILNHYMQNKLMNKMHETISLFREQITLRYEDLSDKEKMLGTKKALVSPKLTHDLFQLMRECEEVDYYDKPMVSAARDVALKMNRMKLLALDYGRILSIDKQFINTALLKVDVPKKDRLNLLRKEFRSGFIKDKMEDENMSRKKAINIYDKLKEQGLLP